MSRIFISTDYYSLETVFDRTQVTNLISIDSIPFYLSLDDGNIIIVKDSIENLPKKFQIDRGSDYLLHHSSIIPVVKNSFNPKNCILGRHDKGDEFLYKPTFEIIVSNSESKSDAIISLLFDPKKLEAIERKKTDFLYAIYNGNTPTIFPKEITPTDEIFQLHKYFTENKYEKQWDLYEDENKGAKQRKKLSLLRDALLAKK